MSQANPHKGQTQVLVKRHASDAGEMEWMSTASAALFTDGGLDVAKFNALSADNQLVATRTPQVDQALRSGSQSAAIAEWINTAEYANKPLGPDYPKCPTDGMSGVVYP